MKALFIALGALVLIGALGLFWLYMELCGLGPHHPHGFC